MIRGTDFDDVICVQQANGLLRVIADGEPLEIHRINGIRETTTPSLPADGSKIELQSWDGNDTIRLNQGGGVDAAADLYGGKGNDIIFSGNGIHTLNGEEGNDYLFGMSDNTHLHGGAGDDWLEPTDEMSESKGFLIDTEGDNILPGKVRAQAFEPELVATTDKGTIGAAFLEWSYCAPEISYQGDYWFIVKLKDSNGNPVDVKVRYNGKAIPADGDYRAVAKDPPIFFPGTFPLPGMSTNRIATSQPCWFTAPCCNSQERRMPRSTFRRRWEC